MSDLGSFPASLIDKSAQEGLPQGFIVRPLARDDYHKGFFECLDSLTWTGDVTEARYHEQYDWLKAKGEGWFYNIVIEHEKRVVGTGVLIVDRKFIWNFGKTGHIEDVSILKSYQSKGLGRRLLQALDSVAYNVGCCKTLLNCSQENAAFYEKCHYFDAGGKEMKHEFAGRNDRPA